MTTINRFLLTALFVGAGATVQAAPLDLTGQVFATYGNTNSYALPVLADINGYGSGPGNPYYIASGPGQIMDQVVIYTGSSGQDVTTNAAGFDNAYQTPSGKPLDYASIAGAVNVTSPGNKAGITNNNANTWDANVASLKAFLGTGNPLFLFNNNDTKSDVTLAVWAKLWITDLAGNLYCGSTTPCGTAGPTNPNGNSGYLYLSNNGQVFNFYETSFANINGDATLYNGGNITTPKTGTTSSSGVTDYVESGFSTGGFNLNLGANQVAYAADVPLLDLWLNDLYGSGKTLSDFTMHLDLKLGCLEATNISAGWTNCTDVAIDNGYEQLFLASSTADFVNVPEPGTMALFGVAMLGIAVSRRRIGK